MIWCSQALLLFPELRKQTSVLYSPLEMTGGDHPVTTVITFPAKDENPGAG